jgi:hypothetical protein
MTDKDQKKARMNWLDEHDSIQLELLKMKEDIVKDPEINSKESKPHKEKEAEDSSRKDTHTLRKDVPDRMEEVEKITPAETSSSTEPLFRQEALTQRRSDDIPKEEPAKLPKGKIPASPDLTRKIANVIQLENKLKRRKYELEKKERDSKEIRTRREKAQGELVQERQKGPQTEEIKSEKKLAPPPEFPEDDTKSKPESEASPPRETNQEEMDRKTPSNEIEAPVEGNKKSDSANGQSTRNAVRRRMIIRRRAPVTENRDGYVVEAIEVEESSSGSDSQSGRIGPENARNEVKTRGGLKGLSRFFKKGKDSK